jgi:hypothetical protein
MSYYKKYLKYKAKYLNLKNVIGGISIVLEKVSEVKRHTSFPIIDDYRNYLDSLNTNKEIFIKNFKDKQFTIHIDQDIYIQKLYTIDDKKIDDKKILYKLSLHNYDSLRSNHVHLIRYIQVLDKDTIQQIDTGVKINKNLFIKYNQKYFTSTINDYFPLEFSLNEKNKLLIQLKFKENYKESRLKNWEKYQTTIKKFIKEINKCLEKSFEIIFNDNFFLNCDFKQKLTELSKENDDITEILDSKNKSKKKKNKQIIFGFWKSLINKDATNINELKTFYAEKVQTAQIKETEREEREEEKKKKEMACIKKAKKKEQSLVYLNYKQKKK